MKRLTTLTSVFFLTVLTCFAQQGEKRRFGAPTYWGPVRTVRIERSEITNQNGTLTEGPRTLLQTISYNEEGTRRELTMYLPGGAVSLKSVDNYDPDGRLLETQSFRGNGNPLSRMVRAYDDNKRLIEQTTYRPDGSVAGRITFVYQDDKRIHRSVHYDQNGVIIGEDTGTLDLKTHRIQTISQTPGQAVQRESGFTNTPDGQVYDEQVNGTPTRRVVSRPLPTGGPEVTEYNPNGSVQSKQRVKSEVDFHGNVVKSVISVANGDSSEFQPAQVMYRTFEYYGKN